MFYPYHVSLSVEAVDGIPELAVDARSLHAALGVGRDFSTWLKARIDKYGFEEGQDFQRIPGGFASPQVKKAPVNGFARIDYRLTLSMAKELCMVENGDAGRAVRRYFIECERRLAQPVRANGDGGGVPRRFTPAVPAIPGEPLFERPPAVPGISGEPRRFASAVAAMPEEPRSESSFERATADRQKELEIHTRAIARILGELHRDLRRESGTVQFEGLYDPGGHAVYVNALGAMDHHHETIERSLDALTYCGRTMAAVVRLHEQSNVTV